MSNRDKVILWIIGGVLVLLFLWLVGPMLAASFTTAVAAVQWFISLVFSIFIGAVTTVASVAVFVIVVVIGVYLILEAVKGATAALGGVVEKLIGVGRQIDSFRKSVSEETRYTAIDTIFLGCLALLSGLAFYMGTGDFLKVEGGPPPPDADLVKLLTVGGFVCAICKMLLMIPARIIKIFSVAFFLLSLGTVVVFLVLRFNLRTPEVAVETTQEVERHIVNANLFTAIAFATLFLLYVMALGYPFSFKRWKRMVFVDK
jgi:hypothetical protein